MQRSDPSTKGHMESSFDFLNRNSGEQWTEVRDELERWFSEVPAKEARDLRARFRSPLESQHAAAWWELYLFTTFRLLGFTIEIHPELADVAGQPDFRLSKGGRSFLLEAATTFSGIVEEGRDPTKEGWIMEAIDKASNPNFFVNLDFDKVGEVRPKDAEIVRPLQQWLSQLDPDDVAENSNDLPTLYLAPKDWGIVLTALPVKADARGIPDHRVLGAGPITSGWVNDIEKARAALDRKRSRYGKPDEPIVLALLFQSAFMKAEDITQALLGQEVYRFPPDNPEAGRMVRQPNGFWMSPGGPRATHVSALLTATGLAAWNFPRTWPRLWLNPWASHPLEADLPFPAALISETGTVELEEEVEPPASLYGLDPEWPGSGPPFPDGD